jgi:hypothetical protein
MNQNRNFHPKIETFVANSATNCYCFAVKPEGEQQKNVTNGIALLADLATVTNNTLSLSGRQFDKITTPTPLQQKALNLLKVSL